MRTNKKVHLVWTWDRETADLRIEKDELVAQLAPHSGSGYVLGVYDAKNRITIEHIKNAKPGKALETKAFARVRFHLGKFARDSAKETRAEIRRLKMFQKRVPV